jgi:hypothetical protein
LRTANRQTDRETAKRERESAYLIVLGKSGEELVDTRSLDNEDIVHCAFNHH